MRECEQAPGSDAMMTLPFSLQLRDADLYLPRPTLAEDYKPFHTVEGVRDECCPLPLSELTFISAAVYPPSRRARDNAVQVSRTCQDQRIPARSFGRRIRVHGSVRHFATRCARCLAFPVLRSAVIDSSELTDMIAVLSETTSGPFLSHLRTQMLSTPSGRALLRERPRITSTSINLDALQHLPENTFGRKYYEWLKRNKVTPDTRDPVSLAARLSLSRSQHRESRVV